MSDLVDAGRLNPDGSQAMYTPAEIEALRAQKRDGNRLAGEALQRRRAAQLAAKPMHPWAAAIPPEGAAEVRVARSLLSEWVHEWEHQRAAIGRLRAALRVQAIRANPALTHEWIDADLDRIEAGP